MELSNIKAIDGYLPPGVVVYSVEIVGVTRIVSCKSQLRLEIRLEEEVRRLTRVWEEIRKIRILSSS